MTTRRPLQLISLFTLLILGTSWQAAVADPFNTFWQKCRASNDKAALAACDRAHELRPWDPVVQKRGDDLFLILEKQGSTTTKPAPAQPAPRAPQPAKPAPRPAPPPRAPVRKPPKDQFDTFWKRCQASNNQAALNACQSALKLRRNNQAVQRRISQLRQLLQRQVRPQTPPPRRTDPFDTHWRKCIARNTKSALNSCNQALKLRPRSQKVRNRQYQLAQLLKPPPAPTEPVRTQPRPETETTPPPVASTEKPDVDKEDVSKAVVSKETVIKNQKILTRLGFDTGGTKGGIGKKTKKAVKDFSEVSGIAISNKLDAQDLIKLESALDAHDTALEKHETAKEEQAAGNINTALALIDEAIEIAPWQKPLHALQAELQLAKKQQTEEIVSELDEDFKELESIE